MSKYDFGYELEEGSTNQWAFNIIEPNTRVLELGASIGNLTKHLHEEKSCVVDIVEIDEEAGKKASKFAKISLLGSVDGDLENENWYKKLLSEKYQYIVILDVLEHLRNPRRVLERVQSLLTEEGKVVLSVPNIAHNSIIVNLWNNKFEYTEYGLLDKTHVHFFTFNSLAEMLNDAHLYIELEDAIYKDLGESEIQNGYQEVPQGIEYFLKTRKYAEIYQYLLVAGKKHKKNHKKIEITKPVGSLYTSIALINGLSENRIEILSDLPDIYLKIDLSKYDNPESVRFIPVEKPCIVKMLKIWGNGKGYKEKLNYNWTTGVSVNKEDIILANEQQEINIELDKQYQTIEISCLCALLNIDQEQLFLPVFSELKYGLDATNQNLSKIQLELEQVKSNWKETKYDLNKTRQALENTEKNLKLSYQNLENQKKDLEKKTEDLIIYREKNQELKNFLTKHTSFTSVVLFDGLLKKQVILSNDGKVIKAELEMKNFMDSESIRFVPSDKNCIITNLKVHGITDKGIERLNYNWTTGINIDEENIFLLDNYREINFLLKQKYKEIKISCSCFLINGDNIQDLHSKLHNWEDERRKLKQSNNSLRESNYSLRLENMNTKAENETLLQSVKEFESTWLYKLFKKGKGVIWKR